MGIINIDMPKRLFYGLVLFFCFVSIAVSPIYRFVTEIVFRSQFLFNLWVIILFLLFIIGIQIILYRESRFKTKKKILFSTLRHLCLVGLWAILISLLRWNRPHLDNIFNLLQGIVSGTKPYSDIVTLISWSLDAEGLDTIFCFSIALTLGHKFLSPVIKLRSREFRDVLMDWLKIIAISEIFQKMLSVLRKSFTFIPDRDGSMWDVLANTVGVFIGLMLCIKSLRLSNKDKEG